MKHLPWFSAGLLLIAVGCGRSETPPTTSPTPPIAPSITPPVTPQTLPAQPMQVEESKPAATPSPSAVEAKAAGADAAVPDAPPAGRVVVFTPIGPLLVDLIIEVDGQPLGAARQQRVDERLAVLRKPDGAEPRWDEALADPRFTFGEDVANRRARDRLVDALDLNRDQRVQPAEGGAFYAQAAGIGPALAIDIDAQSWTAHEASRLWRLTDLDGDGALTEAEIAALPRTLEPLDLDGNELFDEAEVLPAETAARPNASTRSSPPLAIRCDGALQGELFTYAVDELFPDPLAERDPPSTVAALFTKLDANGNRRLDRREPAALATLEPHATVRVAFDAAHRSTTPASTPMPQWEWRDAALAALAAPAACADSAAANAPAGAATMAMPNGDQESEARLGVLRLKLVQQRSPATSAGNQPLGNFAQLDRDNNGYLERGELPEGDDALLRVFTAADGNGDGQLYRAEIDAFAAAQQGLRAAGVRLRIASPRDAWLALIDASGDGRVTLRELHAAGSLLARHDRNQDGRLEFDELPVVVRLEFARSAAPPVRQNEATPSVAADAPKSDAASATDNDAAAKNALDWFARMDLNGDGDLTRREFLGTPAQFEQLDANRDGFIDRSEASAAR